MYDINQSNPTNIVYVVFNGRLLNNDGGLLAFSGHADKGKGDSSPLDCRVTAAIASHIWDTCQKNGFTSLSEEKVKFVLLDCEVSIHDTTLTVMVRPKLTIRLRLNKAIYP